MGLDYVMFSHAYPPMVGGVERHIHGVHTALQARGVDGLVVVAAPRRAPTPRDQTVRWVYSGRLAGIPFTGGIRRLLGFSRYIGWNRGARLHFHDYHTMDDLLPMLRATGSLPRTFLTFHGWEGVYPPEPRVIARRQQLARSVAGHMAIGEYIDRWYGTRADALSYGATDLCARASSYPHWESLPLRAAYLGRFEQDTGVEALVRGLELYNASGSSPIETHLFGRGSLRYQLEGLAASHPGWLHVHGPTDDGEGVLRRFPLVLASGYLTIVEALAAQRPVIAYHETPLRRDYLQMHPMAETMFLCGSPSDVAESLRCCAMTPSAVTTRAMPGWSWAAGRTWDRLAGEYIRLWGL